jgi:hypothetical protein
MCGQNIDAMICECLIGEKYLHHGMTWGTLGPNK